MSVVLDANALVVLALDRRRAPAVEARLTEWRNQGEDLHAPALLRYEIASALARAVAADQVHPSAVDQAWRRITAVPVTLHALEDGPAVVAMTQRLERKSAYDAAYVVLADTLGAEVWILDARFARNATSRGLPVQLTET